MLRCVCHKLLQMLQVGYGFDLDLGLLVAEGEAEQIEPLDPFPT